MNLAATLGEEMSQYLKKPTGQGYNIRCKTIKNVLAGSLGQE